MLKMNIIAPIEDPTDWVNSIVVVEKPNDNLRIYVDPRNLNKAIKRSHYAIPQTRNFTKIRRSKTIHQTRCQQHSLADYS